MPKTDIAKIKQVLLDHGYEYLENIGEGASACVFLCKCNKYNNLFAIKLVSKQKLALQEINALISLIHPNIVKLYSFFTDDEYHYLVMEYCSGGNLKNKGVIPYNQFVKYAKELLQVLGYCHSQKIAHRDIKPENIFIDSYNHVKLGDFGLSNKFSEDESAHQKCGSLMFFSPEILTRTNYDPFKSDIYSLGITFFYLATGKYPFSSSTSKKLKELIIYGQIDLDYLNIDPKIHYLITKMTSKNPQLRPTADQLLKYSIFEDFSSKRLIKSISSSQFHIKSSQKTYDSFLNDNHNSDIPKIQRSDTFSSDCINENDDSEKPMKVQKIRSFYGFNINLKSHKHFVKYD